MKTREELIEFYKDFALDSLYFSLYLNKILNFSNVKSNVFYASLFLFGTPLVCRYDRVLQHPLWFGFLYLTLHFLYYKIRTRNEKQMDLDYTESCFQIDIIKELIKKKKDEKSKSTSKNN